MLKGKMVEMPSKGVVKFKTAKGVYVYHILRAYRGANGKPTNDRIGIGKMDLESGMLIPNHNYFDIYKVDKKTEYTENNDAITVKTSGVTDFCKKALLNSKLSKMLEKVFPDKYKKIIILAEYMLAEGNVMQHIENWCEQNATEDNIIIKSQEVSKIFESITREERMKFFKLMAFARVENEFVAYDVTSISSYSKGIDSVAWGYNRDKESLPQINIGMYYGEQSKLPLFYQMYNGSVNDKSHLKYMLQKNEFVKMNKVKFVMDKGFFSKDNIEILKKGKTRYIIAMPNSLKLTQKLILDNSNDIVGKYETKLGAKLPYAKSVEVTDYGNRLKACIYYNASKASDETDMFLEELEKYENRLTKLEEKEQEHSIYNKYFIITTKNGVKTVEKNVQEINSRMATHGYFVLLTTEHGLSNKEILEIYRNKDVVEKSFYKLKNEVDMRRLRCHTEESTEGKLFIAYIALIIKAYTYERLKEYLQAKNMSYTAVLKELEKIKQITHNNKTTTPTPLTKTQREIMELL